MEITESLLKFNHQYKFPVLSSKDAEVQKVHEHWLVFQEDHMEYRCEYDALWIQEEDEEFGGKKDIQRHHDIYCTFKRESLVGVEVVLISDDNLYKLKIFSTGDVLIVMFRTKEKVIAMKNLLKEYILNK